LAAKKFRWRMAEKIQLLAVDAICYLVITAVLYRWLVPHSEVTRLLFSPGFLFIWANLLGWNYVFGNYEIEVQDNLRKTFQRAAFVFVSTLILATLANYITGKERSGVFGRGVLGGSLLGFWIYLQVSRWTLSKIWRSMHESFRWMFIADTDTKSFVMKDIQSAKTNVSIDWVSKISEEHLLQNASHLFGVVFSVKNRDPGLIDTLMKVRMQGLPVFDLIEFYESQFKKVPIFYLSAEFFSFSKGFSLLGNSYLQRQKRLSDIAISLPLLILTTPVMALVAILIRMESKGGALYWQERSGKDGRVFILYKFRSMRSDAEKSGAQWAQVNDSRVTALGKILRKTRLDELPQLWNILKGDMSFVGPRPERPQFNSELEKSIPFYQLRHLVRPGLTGWAQVHYPYGASIEDAFQKLQYDLFYVKNFSLFLDLQVILKTVRVVVLGQGR
jgi:exopolysaccharide biosynthesis polyprenyl glycosylphosphotransferase